MLKATPGSGVALAVAHNLDRPHAGFAQGAPQK